MRGLEKNNQYDKPANFEAVLNKFKTTQASRNSMIDDLQAQNRAQQEKLEALEKELRVLKEAKEGKPMEIEDETSKIEQLCEW